MVDWIFSQVDSFVNLLCRQILIGVNESLALTIAQLRSGLSSHTEHLQMWLANAVGAKGKAPKSLGFDSFIGKLRAPASAEAGELPQPWLVDAPVQALEFLSRCASVLLYSSYVNVDYLGIEVCL